MRKGGGQFRTKRKKETQRVMFLHPSLSLSSSWACSSVTCRGGGIVLVRNSGSGDDLPPPPSSSSLLLPPSFYVLVKYTHGTSQSSPDSLGVNVTLCEGGGSGSSDCYSTTRAANESARDLLLAVVRSRSSWRFLSRREGGEGAKHLDEEEEEEEEEEVMIY